MNPGNTLVHWFVFLERWRPSEGEQGGEEMRRVFQRRKQVGHGGK